jgi:beta-xylosidase
MALLLTACATPTPAATFTPPAASPPAAAVTATAPPPAAPATESPTAAPTLPPGTFVNPVFDADFPDPDVLLVDGTYYAFSTNSGGLNIPAIRSADLVHWTLLGDALPDLPAWAGQDFGWAWAPEVTTFGAGYVMYFTARFAIARGGTQCIGLATSPQPAGPYSPTGEPFVCQTSQGGSIDAASFVDTDGTPYLLWKNDGNSGGGQTWIHLQQLAPDGLSLVGEPTRLITADQVWEGILVEGPTLWHHAGRYYLFYSANDYASPRYAAGVAVADRLTGPYEKVLDEPVLRTTIAAGVVGPGGQDVVLDDDGEPWLLFHGWAPAGYRRLYLAPLAWEAGLPVVVGPTRDPLPLP